MIISNSGFRLGRGIYIFCHDVFENNRENQVVVKQKVKGAANSSVQIKLL
jgi:hypothetical protein